MEEEISDYDIDDINGLILSSSVLAEEPLKVKK